MQGNENKKHEYKRKEQTNIPTELFDLDFYFM
jgi:hypothetical protein